MALLQGPQFYHELRLQSVWSFSCSPRVCLGFIQVPLGSNLTKTCQEIIWIKTNLCAGLVSKDELVSHPGCFPRVPRDKLQIYSRKNTLHSYTRNYV